MRLFDFSSVKFFFERPMQFIARDFNVKVPTADGCAYGCGSRHVADHPLECPFGAFFTAWKAEGRRRGERFSLRFGRLGAYGNGSPASTAETYE